MSQRLNRISCTVRTAQGPRRIFANYNDEHDGSFSPPRAAAVKAVLEAAQALSSGPVIESDLTDEIDVTPR